MRKEIEINFIFHLTSLSAAEENCCFGDAPSPKKQISGPVTALPQSMGSRGAVLSPAIMGRGAKQGPSCSSINVAPVWTLRASKVLSPVLL